MAQDYIDGPKTQVPAETHDPNAAPYSPYQNGAKVVSQDDDTYSVQTRDGNIVNIAKAPLSKQTRATIDSLPVLNNDQSDIFGRSPASDSASPEAPKSGGFLDGIQSYLTNLHNSMSGPSSNNTNPSVGDKVLSSDGTKYVSPSSPLAPAPESSGNGLQLSPDGTSYVNPNAGSPGASGRGPGQGSIEIFDPNQYQKDLAAAQTGKQLQKADMALVSGVGNPYGQYNKLMNKSLSEQRQAEIENGGMQMESAMTAQDELAKVNKDLQKQDGAIRTTLDTLNKKVMSKEIDPSNFWASKTSGQKAMTWLGAFFAGLGGQTDYWDKLVNQDIDAQKANQSNRLTLYKANLDRFGDENAAAAMTKNMYLAAYAAKADQLRAQMGIAMADPKYLALKAQLAAQIGANNATLQQYKMRQYFDQNGYPDSMSQLVERVNPEGAKNSVKSYDGTRNYIASSPENAKAYTEYLVQKSPVLDNLSRLEQLTHGLDSSIPWTDAYGEAKVLLADTKEKLIHSDIGKPSENALQLAEEQLPNISSPLAWSNAKKKLKTMVQVIKNNINKQSMYRLKGMRPPLPTSEDELGAIKAGK